MFFLVLITTAVWWYESNREDVKMKNGKIIIDSKENIKVKITMIENAKKEYNSVVCEDYIK